MFLDGVKNFCTDSNGYGDPLLIGNNIVFPVEKEFNRAEIVWPEQKNENKNNWAQISELKLLCTEGIALTYTGNPTYETKKVRKFPKKVS